MFAHMPIIREILLGAARRKANLELMCSELKINSSDLYNSEIRVPFDQAVKSWEVAVKETTDKLLGLHLGEQSNPSILGLVGHLMQSTRSLEDAFASVCQFSEMATDMFQYSISKKGDKIILGYKPVSNWLKTSPESARQAIDQAMAGTLNVFQILSGKKIYPVETQLTIKRNKNSNEYERVFQSAINWNSKIDSMIFNSEQLQVPVLSYDQSLMGLFNGLVQQRLKQLKEGVTLNEQIKKEILTTFNGQLPSIQSMALRLSTTTRSLQRKLEEEKKTYREILSEIGKELATALLKQKNVTLTEVALTLGYSDTRSFQRAFKTWTGLSASQFRNKKS